MRIRAREPPLRAADHDLAGLVGEVLLLVHELELLELFLRLVKGVGRLLQLEAGLRQTDRHLLFIEDLQPELGEFELAPGFLGR
jgi:hypothetical protein